VGVVARNCQERRPKSVLQLSQGASADLSQKRFQLRPRVFDRIEVRGVARQMDQPGAGGLDQFADAGRFVRREFIEDNHVTGAKLRPEALLDVRLEGNPSTGDVLTSRPATLLGARTVV
jgi:hypothetical protein